MDKKNNVIIIIIAIILLAVITLVVLRVRDQRLEPAPMTQTEADLNQAVELDTTMDINESLDNIDLTNTSETDLTGVDKELNNL